MGDRRGVRASALEAVLAECVTGRGGANPISTQATVLDLVRTLAAARRRLRVARHLADPGLSAGRVAEAIGVSARHLGRIFRPTGVSPSRYILEQRLDRARQVLADPSSRHLTIAEVAHLPEPGRTPGEMRPLILLALSSSLVEAPSVAAASGCCCPGLIAARPCANCRIPRRLRYCDATCAGSIR
ncbi:helix-turn-helix domain-containing protein [Streptomyces canus]|uniref:helix-turn-helix domain-containing protein n=1 Tax=Streptomyces canus TaxID=58343 RepID=UPI0009988097